MSRDGEVGEVVEIQPFTGPACGTAWIPGSKSLTNRALLCALLSPGETLLTGVLDSADTLAMARAARALGAEIETDGGVRTATQPLPPAPTARVRGIGGAPSRAGSKTAAEPLVVDADQAGTVARFLLPVLAAGRGSFVLDAHPQMRARPMGDLVAALRRLGAQITAAPAGFARRHDPDALPLLVEGCDLARGPAEIGGDVSSQFLSGLLLAGPVMPEGLEVRLRNPESAVSRPYVELTVGVMEAFGATVGRPSPGVFEVAPGGYRPDSRDEPFEFTIEADAAAAGYFWAAAAITGGSVASERLGSASAQGDVEFARVLGEMGCEVSETADAITVAGPRNPAELRGGTFDLRDISDNVPTLAAVAAFAGSPTTITGVGFIRAKESDRIGLTVAELRKRGVDATEHPDGLTVRPQPALLRRGRADSHGDHRLAMAMSLFGLRVAGIEIGGAEAVGKTFPKFFDALGFLREPLNKPRTGRPEPDNLIAVDGPAASGKSSVARLVAERALGRSPADGYLDTGAMYRAVTWAVLRAEVDPADAERVAGIAEKVSLEITDHGDAALQEVLLDGSDVAEAIRSPEVDEAVSVVAANARVRETMVARQRAWAAEHVPAVVDGRDIGSVVLPDAVLKIFLTASPEVRARRRAGQRTAGSVTERDERDSTRTESPLTVAGNAVIVDTSEMKIEEVVGEIAQLYEQAREQAGMTEPGPA